MKTSEFEHAVATGWALASRADPTPLIAYFDAFLAANPHDPNALFEAATSCDYGQQPEKAVERYERAFAAGLSGDRLRRANIQYGATLRNLGRTAEAIAVLRAAALESDVAHIFLALALASEGRANHAVANLIDLLLDRVNSADTQRYGPALRNYAIHLRSNTLPHTNRP